VEFGQEIAVSDKVFQREIAGRDQAHVHAEGMARADGAAIASGHRFGQPFLNRHGQAVDLVDDQSGAVAMLDRADLAVECAGEGAFLMAEQHGFDGIARRRSGVDDAQRHLGALAGGVDCADQHFLAGAAFPSIRTGPWPRRLGRDGQSRAEGGGRADHRLEGGGAMHLFGQRL
jgi:hypothetical protein